MCCQPRFQHCPWSGPSGWWVPPIVEFIDSHSCILSFLNFSEPGWALMVSISLTHQVQVQCCLKIVEIVPQDMKLVPEKCCPASKRPPFPTEPSLIVVVTIPFLFCPVFEHYFFKIYIKPSRFSVSRLSLCHTGIP